MNSVKKINRMLATCKELAGNADEHLKTAKKYPDSYAYWHEQAMRELDAIEIVSVEIRNLLCEVIREEHRNEEMSGS